MSVTVRLLANRLPTTSLHPSSGVRRGVGPDRACSEGRSAFLRCLPVIARRKHWVVRSGWWDVPKAREQEDAGWLLFKDGKPVQPSMLRKTVVERHTELDGAERPAANENRTTGHENNGNGVVRSSDEAALSSKAMGWEGRVPHVGGAESKSAHVNGNDIAEASSTMQPPRIEEQDGGSAHHLALEAQFLLAERDREGPSVVEMEEPPDVGRSKSHDTSLHEEEPPPTHDAGSTAGTAPTIELHYDTGWENAFLHCNVDDNGWTEAPGRVMGTASCEEEELPALKVIVVEGRSMEFVITNGHGDWDRSSDGSNYRISHPGLYVLSFGELKSLSVLQPIDY